MGPIDPVSGNPVPPGAAPNEVRDDIPAKLSEGEFVIPANVVRFYGLKFFNNLMNKAKDELGDTQEDDLPFPPEELESDAGPVQMAVGGFVAGQGGFTTNPTTPDEVDPVVPLFRRPRTVFNTAPDGEGQEPHEGPTGLAGGVDQWSVDNFSDYANNRGSLVNRGIQTFISRSIPFGGLLMNHRYNYLEREVPTKLDEMIEAGKDQKGNSLTPAQLDSLKAARTKLQEEGEFRPGIKGAIREGMQSLFGKEEVPEESPPTAQPERTEPARPEQARQENSSDKRSTREKIESGSSKDQMKSETKETNKGGKTTSSTPR